jgi:hypothetical protein
MEVALRAKLLLRHVKVLTEAMDLLDTEVTRMKQELRDLKLRIAENKERFGRLSSEFRDEGDLDEKEREEKRQWLLAQGFL